MFDTDFDHTMETVLMGQPESEMLYCVRHFQIIDESGKVAAEEQNNYLTQWNRIFPEPLHTHKLTLKILRVWGGSPPGAVYAFRCYRE